MGLGKWWLKHGPGSPGSIARALIKDYLRWRAENPDATETELLSYVLQTRVTAHRMLGHDSLSVPDQENLIDSCDGKLERLILAIVHLENPAADQALHTAPKVYRKMTEVINEAVSKIRTKRAPPASKQQNDAPSFELEDYQGAIGDYTKAIGLKPDYADAYGNIGSGLAKFDLEDYQGAIADFTKAIALKPDIAYAYCSRGIAKAQLKDYQGAIADYTKAIELKPDFAYAYFGRGEAKFQLKDYQEAIADYTKAIELKPDFLRPDFAELYNDRGLAKYHLQDHQGAIADYTKAIGLKPDDAKAYNNRGLAYLLLDQKDKAWADFMRAIELGQRIPQEVLDMCK